jgi:small subunit ribosomal protein S9
MNMATSMSNWYGTGRRKEATARVWIEPGDGTVVINGRPMAEYFGRKTSIMILEQPLQLLEQVGKLNIKVNVTGGGLSGQAGAIRHGLSRALVASNSDFRPTLKKAGFLTRDPRAVERKKYGQPGARRRFQFSKR